MVAIAGMRLGLFTDEFSPIYKESAEQFVAYYIPQVMQGILSDPPTQKRSNPSQRCGVSLARTTYRREAQAATARGRSLDRAARRLVR